MSWIRARVSFALLRSALLCLRRSRAKRRIHLESLPEWLWQRERTCEYSLKTLKTIFYFLLFILFLGRFPYLKLISYILLSYFCNINVGSKGLKFSCNKHSFLRMLYYSTVILGFTSLRTEEKKKIDFEVSHVKVILIIIIFIIIECILTYLFKTVPTPRFGNERKKHCELWFYKSNSQTNFSTHLETFY